MTPSEISGKGMALLGIFCALDVAFCVTLLIFISMTTPLLVAVACVLSIPMAVVADVIVHDQWPVSWESYTGMLAIIVGFLLMVMEEGKAHKSTKRHANVSMEP